MAVLLSLSPQDIILTLDFRWDSMEMRRNVVLSLRIDSEETRRLGVDAHVCELQLTLRRFAELLVRLNVQEQRLFQCHCRSKDYLFDFCHILS